MNNSQRLVEAAQYFARQRGQTAVNTSAGDPKTYAWGWTAQTPQCQAYDAITASCWLAL